MDELLLTFYCANIDATLLVTVLRAATKSPLHLRQEQVFGHDFGDARTAEQVRGCMDRTAISFTATTATLDTLVALVTAARRAMPVRWQAVALLARGRIE
ncbi:DUF3240 family protein [Sphingomonas sp. 28-63-12]|uniref:DUF3240 family protein n=1 Tax=Sphingomonas sp. 28-63-12 TaxID=1970434 RepID=UPI000BDDD948|nr:MAG: hypothetical protein B7Y47_06615 [Sphingomonas sp. 28-63-12]